MISFWIYLILIVLGSQYLAKVIYHYHKDHQVIVNVINHYNSSRKSKRFLFYQFCSIFLFAAIGIGYLYLALWLSKEVPIYEIE